MAEQRLVGRFDGALAGFRRDVGGEQARRDQMLDERPRLFGDLGQAGDAAAGRAGFRVDAGEPGDEGTAKQREPRGAVPRDGRIGVGSPERPLDRRLDRAPDAAERAVLLEGQAPPPPYSR